MSDDAISVISNIVLTPKRDQTKNPNRELQRKEGERADFQDFRDSIMFEPSLGPAMDAVLRALPQVDCSATDPKRCYCARGTTKPIAEISPAGVVLQVFCSGPEAKRVLVRRF
jgi:hypothetical protein